MGRVGEVEQVYRGMKQGSYDVVQVEQSDARREQHHSLSLLIMNHIQEQSSLPFYFKRAKLGK